MRLRQSQIDLRRSDLPVDRDRCLRQSRRATPAEPSNSDLLGTKHTAAQQPAVQQPAPAASADIIFLSPKHDSGSTRSNIRGDDRQNCCAEGKFGNVGLPGGHEGL